jgi:hypothetical protein
MIQFGRLSPQTSLNVAQAFPRGELREGQASKLINARKMLDLVLATITSHATAKDLPG